MRDLVRQARTSYLIRKTADEIIRPVPSKDFAGEAERLFEWVKSNIRYTQDPDGVEFLQSPEQLLSSRSGDCDDMSILLASLLNVIGHPVAFKAVGDSGIGELSHVYVLTLIGRRWYALDSTEPHGMGWEPPGITDQYIQKV